MIRKNKLLFTTKKYNFVVILSIIKIIYYKITIIYQIVSAMIHESQQCMIVYTANQRKVAVAVLFSLLNPINYFQLNAQKYF